MARPPRGASLAERLQHYLQQTPDGCWVWGGPWLDAQRAGYVVIHDRKQLAHRLAWELQHGPIPAGYRLTSLLRA
jgi:hypothetical protein